MNIASFADSGPGNRPDGGNLSLYLGLLPVLLLLALVIGFRLFPHAVVVYEPRFLLPIFNTVLFLASCLIAYIALRSYLLNGASTTLWLGCGVWTLGTGALAAGWLIFPFGANVNVTIFNVSVLLASICHTGAVIVNLEEKPGDRPGRRWRKVTLAYSAVLTVNALLTGLTLSGLMPPFFIQGRGPTEIRQYVVEWAIVLFSFSSLVIMNRFLRCRARFLYWYSLALALVALAMLAFFLQPAVGSPIGWLGRTSYLLAAIYFLISVSSAWREAGTRGVGLEEAIGALFGPGLHWQEILATVSDAMVACDNQGRILLWNKAAESSFGYRASEVMGKDLNLILPQTQALDPQALGGGIKEIELLRQDGSGFGAEVSVSTKSSALGVINTLVIRDVTARKEAEKALHASEARFRALFEGAAVGIALTNLAGRIIESNAAYQELTGYSHDELRGKPFAELTHPDDLPKNPELAGGLWAGTSDRLSLEKRYIRKDGRVIWVRLAATLVRDERSEPDFLVAIAEDITERQRAEEALRESEAHYRSLFSHMQEGFAYCQMHFEQNRPTDFTYLEVNDAFADLTGLKDVVGKKVSEVIPGIREADPELFEIYGRVALTGKPERFEKYLDLLKMWFSISVYSPQPEYFVAVFDVITARKRAEAALRESEARFRGLFENMTEGVALHEIIYDEQHEPADYRILAVNPAFTVHTGLKPEQINGHLASTAYGTGEAPFLETYTQVAQTGQPVSFETFFEQLGRHYYISATSSQPGQFVTVFEDITVRKRMEDELLRAKDELEQRVEERTVELQETVAQLEEEMSERQQAELEIKKLNDALERRVRERTAELEFANRELESFSYSVSHDLKAPIRAIEGFSRILLGEHAARLDEEGQRLFTVICSNTKIMANLIDDLLALSRLGRQQIRKSDIDLAALVRQDFDRLRAEEEERDLQLIVPDLPGAWGDPALINQVIMNLLGNAIKYTRVQKTASIEVGGHSQDRETVYYVKDNGVGFDERYAHKLFGVFQRLHVGPEYEGTGVGLAIVQRIIHRHGGRVWAKGKIGEGATFYFTLPR